MLKGISPKKSQAAIDPSQAEVGEVDTRTPFQSVKDAVYLFDEYASSDEKGKIDKSRPHSAERAMAKETKFHLAWKELGTLKQQISDAENTKSQAITELQKAKETVNTLSNKLIAANKSKDAALRDEEAEKSCYGELPETANSRELDTARDQCIIATTELDAKKQELAETRCKVSETLKQEGDSKKQTEQADMAAKNHQYRANELGGKISSMRNSIEQANIAALHTREEIKKIHEEKDILRSSYRTKLTDLRSKCSLLKKKCDDNSASNLKQQLAEKTAAVSNLQREIKEMKCSDMNSVRRVCTELEEAREKKKKAAEEEGLMLNRLEALKVELENVKKDHCLLKDKEAGTESIAATLHVKLRKSDGDLEALSLQHSKTDSALSAFQHVVTETENIRRVAESTRCRADELNIEAEILRVVLLQAEETLAGVSREAEEAKAGEGEALKEMRLLSETRAPARVGLSECEAMRRKSAEVGVLAEMKVSAAVARVKAIRASERDAAKRLGIAVEEISGTKAAIEEALKRVEMAEAAKKAVEGELKRRREREQMVETEVTVDVRKLEKEKLSFSKKALLPSLSGILLRRKNQVKTKSRPSLFSF